MATINPDLSGLVDGQVGDAADWTSPFNTVINAINGGLDTNNFTAVGTNIQTIAQSVAFSTFTPTWTATGTAPAVGNATLTGRYIKIGRLYIVQMEWTPGSTTTYGTGTYAFATPAAMTSSVDNTCVLGGANVEDAGTATYSGFFRKRDANNVEISVPGAAGSNLIGQTVPFTWGTADTMSGFYIMESES